MLRYKLSFTLVKAYTSDVRIIPVFYSILCGQRKNEKHQSVDSANLFDFYFFLLLREVGEVLPK